VTLPSSPMRGLWALLALVCAVLPTQVRAEFLYLHVEVRQEGKLVAKPHLLGETGKSLHAVRRAPGAQEADYSLRLTPSVEGDHYALQLGVEVRGEHGKSRVELGHGQRRQVQLEGGKQLEVSVLLMRVDSPEFRAYMDLPAQPPPATDGRKRAI